MTIRIGGRMTLFRRLRGVAVSAITWAVLFAAVGLARLPVYAALGTRFPPTGAWPIIRRVAVQGALAGLASGALFAAIIILTERRRNVDARSGRRFALWGLGAGVLFIGGANVVYATMGRLPLDLSTVVWTAFCGAVGAGLGAGTFWLARRNARHIDQGGSPLAARVI
jgi:hypothetical protein